jgi:hypothetical protein
MPYILRAFLRRIKRTRRLWNVWGSLAPLPETLEGSSGLLEGKNGYAARQGRPAGVNSGGCRPALWEQRKIETEFESGVTAYIASDCG